jgi:hypothetical protein
MSLFREIPDEIYRHLERYTYPGFPRRFFRGCPLDAFLNDFNFVCDRCKVLYDDMLLLSMCAQACRNNTVNISYKQHFLTLMCCIATELCRITTETTTLCMGDREITFTDLFSLAIGHVLGVRIPTKVRIRGWILINVHRLADVLGVDAALVSRILTIADFVYVPAVNLPDELKNIYPIAHTPQPRHWRAYRLVGCNDFMHRIPFAVLPSMSDYAVKVTGRDVSGFIKKVTRLQDLRDMVARLSVVLTHLRQLTDEECDDDMTYHEHIPSLVYMLSQCVPYVKRAFFAFLGIFVRDTCRKDVFMIFIHHAQLTRVVFNNRECVFYPDMCAVVRAFDDYLGYSEELPVARFSRDMKDVQSIDHSDEQMGDDCWWKHSYTMQRTSHVTVDSYLTKLRGL